MKPFGKPIKRFLIPCVRNIPSKKEIISFSHSLCLILSFSHSPYLSFSKLSEFSSLISSSPLYIIKIIYICLYFYLHLFLFYNVFYFICFLWFFNISFYFSIFFFLITIGRTRICSLKNNIYFILLLKIVTYNKCQTTFYFRKQKTFHFTFYF